MLVQIVGVDKVFYSAFQGGKGSLGPVVMNTRVGIVRIYAEPFAYNIASRRILEKNGFVCEGILRNNAVKNGKILDMMMYSLIK